MVRRWSDWNATGTRDSRLVIRKIRRRKEEIMERRRHDTLTLTYSPSGNICLSLRYEVVSRMMEALSSWAVPVTGRGSIWDKHWNCSFSFSLLVRAAFLDFRLGRSFIVNSGEANTHTHTHTQSTHTQRLLFTFASRVSESEQVRKSSSQQQQKEEKRTKF